MWFKKHWVALAGLFLPALYLYLQIQVWKKHGDDLTMVTLGIVGTVVLWVFLGYVLTRYWRDAKRGKSLHAQIVTIKDQFKTEADGLRAQLKNRDETITEVRAARDAEVAEKHRLQEKLTEQDIQSAKLMGQPIVDFEDHGSNYEIEAALFGAPGHAPHDVSRKVKELIASGSKSIPVSWVDLMGRDPIPNVLKSLVLKLSITRSEGKEIFLPPTPAEMQQVNSQREELTQKRIQYTTLLNDYNEDRQEIATLKDFVGKQRASLAECQAELEKAKRANVPSLLIEYRIERELEYLTFINDGLPTIKDFVIGPLLWDTAYRREINLHNVLGPLQSKQRVDAKFGVFEQIGNSQVMLKLPDMLREIIRKGCEATARVTVSYADMNGMRFSQRFSLSIDPFNRVVWNPDPASRESDASVAL